MLNFILTTLTCYSSIWQVYTEENALLGLLGWNYVLEEWKYLPCSSLGEKYTKQSIMFELSLFNSRNEEQ